MKSKQPHKGTTPTTALRFIEDLEKVRQNIVITSASKENLSLEKGIKYTIKIMDLCDKKGGKLIFIGNGGSAAIASHQAVDYWKNGGRRAIAFNDSSLLTCISNDLGYERVFAEPISMFAQPGDLLLAISSSGRSPNIIKGVDAAQKKDCAIITFSGFDYNNPLRSKGDLNFYVPSHVYGIVEITHLSLIHATLEELM